MKKLIITGIITIGSLVSMAQAPKITALEPLSGIAGTQVTITGINFETTAANNTVTFAGVTATVALALQNQLKVIVPVTTAGIGDVIITNVNGSSATFNFTVLSPPSPGVFGDQNIITSTADGAYSVYAADMDGDGDMDVLAASTNDGKIDWFENDGKGGFNVSSASTMTLNRVDEVFAVDLDGDGDMDVLAGAVLDNVAWFENDGAGNLSLPSSATNISGANAIFAADLDDDGDMDVIVGTQQNGIYWFENNGTGVFTLPTSSTIATFENADYVQSVYASDLDGDGDLDVLAAMQNDNKIVWYENNGTGSFTTLPAISTSVDGANSVYAADLDGDGDMDVVSASVRDDKIAWYKNDGAGGFTLPTTSTISLEADAVKSVYVADMDGDGDLDVLSASYGNDAITWYENDGLGGFSLSESSAITITADGAYSVYAADFDGDGDLDILTASKNDDKIVWYENNVSNITRIEPVAAISGNSIKIYGTSMDPNATKATFNGSLGIIDIANSTSSVLTVTVPNITPGTVDVTLSSPTGYSELNVPTNFTVISSFSPDTLIAQSAISTNAGGAMAVYAADMDGDGDMDVLSASGGDDKIAWYENNGEGVFTLPASSTLTTMADGAMSVYAADLDGDGDLDVLSASANDNKIAWYENDGTGGFSLPVSSIITSTAIGASSVYAADVDGDGDLDVLSASREDYTIAWYENNGTGNFTIPASSILTNTANWATSVYAADLDGDGDLDVLSASWGDDKIAWYKNDGAGGFTLPASSTITTTADAASSVYAADLDGDGDMDVLSASGNDNKIAWYENDGAGVFTSSIISITADGTQYVYAADMDGDGDMDVVSSSYSDDLVACYKNDGTGVFILDTSYTIANTADGVKSIYAADLDGDGDMDMLSASIKDDKIAWYESMFTGNAIIAFGDAQQNQPAIIDAINYTIDLEVNNGVNLTSFNPSYTLSPGASVIISSTDYSTEVTYMVTSEIGVSQDWLVNVVPVTDAPIMTLDQVDQSSANFSWNQPAYTVGYKLEVSPDAVFSGFITGYSPKNISDAAAYNESLSGLTAGTLYYARIRAYNQFDTESVNSTTLTILTIPEAPSVNPATSITSSSFQTSWNAVTGASYYILEVSGDDFSSLALKDSISGLLIADVTGLSPITEYKYRLKAGNLSGVSGYSNIITVTTPFTDEESPVIPFEYFGGTDDTWNLFSIPYDLVNKSIGSIFADYDPARHEYDWRIVHYRNSTNDYVNFNAGQVKLGDAYWFNAKENITVKVGSGQVPTQKTFTKALLSGWNLIGNPYPVNISWEQVILDNPTVTNVGSLQVFNRRSQTTGDIMTPFSGGFVWSDQATSIVIDPQSASSGGRTNSTKRKIESDDIDWPEWMIDIYLIKNDIEEKIGGFGMHPDAIILKDRYDAMAVPRFIVYTDLSTEHQDYFYPWFAADVVPTVSSYTWAFTLASNEVYNSTILKWDKAALQGKVASLYLLDKSSGKLINMKLEESHVVDLSSGDFKFEIYFVSDKGPILPADLILGTAYPNPAHTLTTIPVILPVGLGQKSINLSIYDINGKLITTLAAGKYEPGVYEFTWDVAKNISNSGMFIYRLIINDSSFPPIQKKLIIR